MLQVKVHNNFEEKISIVSLLCNCLPRFAWAHFLGSVLTQNQIEITSDQNQYEHSRYAFTLHAWLSFLLLFLIQSADPQSQPEVIIIFTRGVRPYVRPSVPTFPKQISAGETVGLAEWIINETCLVSYELERIAESLRCFGKKLFFCSFWCFSGTSWFFS